MTGVLVALGLVAMAIALSRVLALGLERELAVTTVRAVVQLTVVGAVVTGGLRARGRRRGSSR